MDKTIALIQSRTVWAAAIALIAAVANVMGWQSILAFTSDSALQERILNFVSVLGSAGAMWFRYGAKSEVVSVLPKSTDATKVLSLVIALTLAAGALLSLSACQSAQIAAASCAGAEAGTQLAVIVTADPATGEALSGSAKSAAKAQRVTAALCPALVAAAAAATAK